ncbi:zeta toxin family protein [Aliamphritea ceti]|uniref:zeta toxin family protein n=1 Tax=Aliamphritea ceti TaxID=1524258 RepID=UPI0021C2D964|nr:zeta toxin family protein [Aliamphritea ceti]
MQRPEPKVRVDDDYYSAWSPGLDAELPKDLLDQETIFLPEHTDSNFRDVMEWVDQTGMAAGDLVAFRPARLALHELIVRVTADLQVMEGETEAALGINFRIIVTDIFEHFIQPKLPDICNQFETLQRSIEQSVKGILTEQLTASPVQAEQQKSGWRRWLPWLAVKPKTPPVRPIAESALERDYRVVNGFKLAGLASQNDLTRAVYRSLYQVLGAVAGRRGYLGADLNSLSLLVTRHVMNSYGSRCMGEWIVPCIEAAVQTRGYLKVEKVTEPLLISLKGASAAGKSSLRPMLQKILRTRGIKPGSYATVSPDIWRRLLLDYETLGQAYKYAGRFTSSEVNVVDAKFDHYVRRQADEQASISHLLVDRFRFDSFSSEKVSKILHDTYAKYVHTLQMYFVVTPPEATVERGWERGLQRGRYKAVEDFLGHSVEAYVGMPKIFCKWLAYDRPLFSYEFLDNSVPKGEFPLLIAKGTQKSMCIYRPLGLVNIQRYQKINIYATRPEDVYPANVELDVEHNSQFLLECLRRIPKVTLIDPESDTAYLECHQNESRILDEPLYQQCLEDQELAAVLNVIRMR